MNNQQITETNGIVATIIDEALRSEKQRREKFSDKLKYVLEKIGGKIEFNEEKQDGNLPLIIHTDDNGEQYIDRITGVEIMSDFYGNNVPTCKLENSDDTIPAWFLGVGEISSILTCISAELSCQEDLVV